MLQNNKNSKLFIVKLSIINNMGGKNDKILL